MHSRFFQAMFSLAMTIEVAGCGYPATSNGSLVLPTTTLALSGAPDLTATVTAATNEGGLTPEGYRSQYDIWVAIPPAQAADAGVVIAPSTSVFMSTGGVIDSTTAASIKVGDVVQVWHDAGVVYGAVQAPPGAPAYNGTQVVIVR